MSDAPAVVERVMSAVATAEGVDETQLPALYDVVDPDALEELVHHAARSPGAYLIVEFTYAGHAVTVDDSGRVSVES